MTTTPGAAHGAGMDTNTITPSTGDVREGFGRCIRYWQHIETGYVHPKPDALEPNPALWREVTVTPVVTPCCDARETVDGADGS